MVRDFTEKKKEELYKALDIIDNKEWQPFMSWCSGRANEFGEWADRLGIPSYMKPLDNYQNRILETNESTREQIDTIFANVAEVDQKYAKILRGYQETVKEQMARVQAMTEVMRSAANNGVMQTMNLSEKEEESMSDREKMVLSGQEILKKRLEGEGISQAECQRICDMIMENNPGMLLNLYITDCYSGVDSDRVYIIIKEYYEEHKNDDKLDYAEEILRKYLTAQGITNAEEQQDIIDMIRVNQPGMLLNLYITDCYSSTDSIAVEKAIMDYYNNIKYTDIDYIVDQISEIDVYTYDEMFSLNTYDLLARMIYQEMKNPAEGQQNQVLWATINRYFSEKNFTYGKERTLRFILEQGGYESINKNNEAEFNAYHPDYDSEGWGNAKRLAAVFYSLVGELNAADVDEEMVKEAVSYSQDIYGNNIENTIGNCNSFYGDGIHNHFYEQ